MFLNSNWSKKLKYKTYLFWSLNPNNFNTAFPPNFFANYCPYDVWGTQYNTLEGLNLTNEEKTTISPLVTVAIREGCYCSNKIVSWFPSWFLEEFGWWLCSWSHFACIYGGMKDLEWNWRRFLGFSWSFLREEKIKKMKKKKNEEVFFLTHIYNHLTIKRTILPLHL